MRSTLMSLRQLIIHQRQPKQQMLLEHLFPSTWINNNETQSLGCAIRWNKEVYPKLYTQRTPITCEIRSSWQHSAAAGRPAPPVRWTSFIREGYAVMYTYIFKIVFSHFQKLTNISNRNTAQHPVLQTEDITEQGEVNATNVEKQVKQTTVSNTRGKGRGRLPFQNSTQQEKEFQWLSDNS